jgi:hypothetical protein
LFGVFDHLLPWDVHDRGHGHVYSTNKLVCISTRAYLPRKARDARQLYQ